MKKYSLILVFIALHFSLAAQTVLDSQNKVTISLKDGEIVTLFGKATSLSANFSNEYYYLPANLRLSERKDGVPEFLFAKYTTEEREDAGGVQGAIMHLLMKWGLTKKQEQEATRLLRSKLRSLKNSGDPIYDNINPESVTIKGAVGIKPGENSFRIISAILSNKDNRLVTGPAPLIPGSKVAVAAMMEKNSAQLMASTFEKAKSITDLSVTIDYKYDLLMPAVNGEIVFHWEKIDSVFQKDYQRKTTDADVTFDPKWHSVFTGDWFGKDKTFDYTETKDLFQFFSEEKVIEINIDKTVNDELADKIITQYMDIFMQSISDKDDPSLSIPSSKPGGDKDLSGIDRGSDNWTINKTKIEKKVAKRTERFNLQLRTVLPFEGSITGNMADWYNHSKDNKNCVYYVNLNDPFFKHRDVNIVLDLDAEDMIGQGKEVNYATVNVRKKRSTEGAHDYFESVTFDRSYFEQNGNKATLTYSRAEDDTPEEYEYKVQWSLRGGNVFPRDTNWIKGDWQGISLSPPVKPVPIQFEVDLAELKRLKLRNVSLQVRYKKLGKEVESGMNISLYKKEPYLQKTLYMDHDAKGYAYRLIFTHQEHGVLAMPWQANINTGYVFGVVPKELRNGDTEFINQAIDAGKVILNTAGEGKEIDKTNRVLDRFKDLIE